MRLSNCHACGCLVLWAGLLTGCQTAGPPLHLSDPGLELPALTEENRILGEVLSRYAQGLIHESDREYEKALANYLQAVELDPDNEDLNFRIVTGLLRQKRTDEALTVIKAITERNPKSEKAVAWLALVYRASDQPEQAREAYEQLIRIDPTHAPPYIDYAAFHLQQDEQEKAKAILIQGTRKAKEPLDLYRTLANILIEETSRAESPEEARALREEAIQWYEKSAKIADQNLEILLKLGNLYISNERHMDALERFRDVEELLPDDLGILRRLALRFAVALPDRETDAEAIQTAIENLETLAQAHSGHEQIHYYLGELYIESNEIGKSKANFELAAEATRDNPLPFIRKAMLEMEEDPKWAEETLFRGLEKLPENGRISEAIAHCYLQTDEHELSFEWFVMASKRLPPDYLNPRFHYNFATAAFLSSHRTESIDALSQAAEPSPILLQLFMEERLHELDTKEVHSFFAAYVEARPEDPAAYLMLGLLNSINEEFTEAIENFSRTLSLAQAENNEKGLLDDRFYFSFAAAHERSGQYEKAERYFLRALDLNPENARSHNYLAYMWAERGVKLERALDHVEIALNLKPNSGAFADTLGWIYYMQEKYEEALKEIQRADEFEPDDPTISDHLGDILFKLDRIEEAVVQWKRSFVLDPGSETVAEKLIHQGIDLDPLREEAKTHAERLEQEREAAASAEEGEPVVRPALSGMAADLGGPGQNRSTPSGELEEPISVDPAGGETDPEPDEPVEPDPGPDPESSDADAPKPGPQQAPSTEDLPATVP
jgi:tetratricopeptide (TPR) repeat protein